MDFYLRDAWNSACGRGLVNEHVLYELEQASSLLFQDLLKEYRDYLSSSPAQKQQQRRSQGGGIAYDKTYHLELLKLIPMEWKRHTAANMEQLEIDKEKLLQENARNNA